MSTSPALVEVIGDAVRAVRYERVLSQRDLAQELGVSKSYVGRLGSGGLAGSMRVLEEVLSRLGLGLVVVERPAAGPDGEGGRGAGGREPDLAVEPVVEGPVVEGPLVEGPLRTPPHRFADGLRSSLEAVSGGRPGWPVETSSEVHEIVACWRERVDDELVRDALGRRPPAHRHVYPRRVPHWWWVRRHPRTPWVDRPIWSWSREVTSPQEVLRLGRYARPVGLPPRGGAPMQGYPPYVRPDHHLPRWMERRWEAEAPARPPPGGEN